jgi:hypothetical protein
MSGDIVNELLARDLVLGTLAREAEECSEDNKNMAALACLFIIIEQAIKFALDKTEGNFYRLLRIAKEKNLISAKEFSIINQIRQIRNKMFHESHYAWFSEKDGILYQFSEDKTKKEIYNAFSDECFKIVLKLLSTV